MIFFFAIDCNKCIRLCVPVTDGSLLFCFVNVAGIALERTLIVLQLKAAYSTSLIFRLRTLLISLARQRRLRFIEWDLAQVAGVAVGFRPG